MENAKAKGINIFQANTRVNAKASKVAAVINRLLTASVAGITKASYWQGSGWMMRPEKGRMVGICQITWDL